MVASSAFLAKPRGLKNPTGERTLGSFSAVTKELREAAFFSAEWAGAKAVAERLMRAAANFAFCIVF